jgi:hypothetical protein
MATRPFIKLFKTLQQALYVETSPYDKQFIMRGVQLLPNNPYPYIQSTDNANGVEVEDWAVTAVNLCDGSITDITAYFEVKEVFFDDNGQNQISWAITNIPFDFGVDFIYLVVDQVGQKYYSNPFQITANNSEYTSRFDYRDDEDSIMQSIQLGVFYRENMIEQELESYHQISTGITVTATTKTKEYKKFLSDFLPKSLIIDLTKLFSYNTFVYLNLKRANLFKPIETPDKKLQSNFSLLTMFVSEIGGADYDPLYEPPALLPDYNILDYSSIDYKTN